MEESFKYIKDLIDAERYKDYKTEYWGGCDVVIVSKNEYKRKQKTLNDWEKGCRKLITTEYACFIIWLIETLKPYIRYDYLNKFEYYKELAEIIEIEIKKNDIDEKELLKNILEKINPRWEKTFNEEDLPNDGFFNWYKFGIEHNDPFFVKFIALWMGFNKIFNSYYARIRRIEYKKNNNRLHFYSETDQIELFCINHSHIIDSIYEKIFSPSLTDIFMDDPVEDMKKRNTTIVDELYNELKNNTGIDKTIALLITIYRVRCNLIHGSKRTDISRDIKLVSCSGEIMEIFMNAIIETRFNLNNYILLPERNNNIHEKNKDGNR